jgi:hypothetical protein
MIIPTKFGYNRPGCSPRRLKCKSLRTTEDDECKWMIIAHMIRWVRLGKLVKMLQNKSYIVQFLNVTQK